MKKTPWTLLLLTCFAQLFPQATLAQTPQVIPKTVRVKIINEISEKTEIKVLNFESYIAGVISKEMPLSWPQEALKAQAVVARNYALHKMNINQNKDFDVRNDFWDQVFQPTDNIKANKASSETKDIRLTDENGRTIQTFFHADCGGQTVPAWSVWPGSKSYGVAEDTYCKKRTRSTWTFAVDREKFIVDTSADKVKAQKFKSKWVSLASLTMNEIRKTFGFDQIRSHPDQIKIEEDKVVFSGRGYGHGVGLCQWGAMEMARVGLSYKQILAHYYPKAFIEDGSSRLAQQ